MKASRSTRPYFVFLMEFSGWKVKVYGVASESEDLSPRVVDQACRIARRELRRPGSCNGCPGVGFLMVHRGDDGTRLWIDWWSGSALDQRTFFASADHPFAFQRVRRGCTRGSTSERAIVDHERRAWNHHVLSHPTEPDLRAYLEDRLETESAA